MSLKRVSLVLLACALIGCSKGTMTSPSNSASSSSAVASGQVPTVNPKAVNDPTAQWLMTGPTGADGKCLTKADLAAMPFNEIVWDFIVKDAGDKGIEGFQMMAHHSDKAGCAPTTENPRERIRLTAGPTHYAPHQSGTTRFAAPANEYQCGSLQWDIQLRDGTLIAWPGANLGEDCPGVPPPMPQPQPNPQPAPICPAFNAILQGSPLFYRYDARMESMHVSFTMRSDLAGPVRLAFASYEIAPWAWEQIPGQAFLDQWLRWHNSGIYQPGQSYEVAVVVPDGNAQIDVLACDEPTEHLTKDNYWYWWERTLGATTTR